MLLRHFIFFYYSHSLFVALSIAYLYPDEQNKLVGFKIYFNNLLLFRNRVLLDDSFQVIKIYLISLVGNAKTQKFETYLKNVLRRC